MHFHDRFEQMHSLVMHYLILHLKDSEHEKKRFLIDGSRNHMLCVMSVTDVENMCCENVVECKFHSCS